MKDHARESVEEGDLGGIVVDGVVDECGDACQFARADIGGELAFGGIVVNCGTELEAGRSGFLDILGAEMGQNV